MNIIVRDLTPSTVIVKDETAAATPRSDRIRCHRETPERSRGDLAFTNICHCEDPKGLWQSNVLSPCHPKLDSGSMSLERQIEKDEFASSLKPAPRKDKREKMRLPRLRLAVTE